MVEAPPRAPVRFLPDANLRLHEQPRLRGSAF
jgi:hypothetical protein